MKRRTFNITDELDDALDREARRQDVSLGPRSPATL
jgi:hypothetical protein